MHNAANRLGQFIVFKLNSWGLRCIRQTRAAVGVVIILRIVTTIALRGIRVNRVTAIHAAQTLLVSTPTEILLNSYFVCLYFFFIFFFFAPSNPTNGDKVIDRRVRRRFLIEFD